MMRSDHLARRAGTFAAFGLAAWVAAPAQALGATLVRFIHAVPGVGKATIDITSGGGQQNAGSVAFGQVSSFRSVRAGSFRWKLEGGGKTLASGTSTVGAGVYDIAIVPAGQTVKMAVYKDAGAEPNATLLRVVHVAPELGAPMFMLGAATLADRLPYTHATRYYAIAPGRHEVSAMKPWLMKPGDPTLMDLKNVRFSAGTAYTAFAIGSMGQRVRLVRVVDRGAPLTRPAALPHPAQQNADMSMGTTVVRHGDSLWSIAQRSCGPHADTADIQRQMEAIWRMNARRIGTGDPNLLFAGTRLMIPPDRG